MFFQLDLNLLVLSIFLISFDVLMIMPVIYLKRSSEIKGETKEDKK